MWSKTYVPIANQHIDADGLPLPSPPSQIKIFREVSPEGSSTRIMQNAKKTRKTLQ